jgi:hypothetical protein
MKTKQRRRAKGHDPMLVLNISNSNFTNGGRRTFFEYEYVRFNA